MKSLGVPSRYVTNNSKSKAKNANKSKIVGKKKTNSSISSKKNNNSSFISSSSKLKNHKEGSSSSSSQTLLSIDKKFAEYLDRKEREKIEESLNQRPPWNPTSRRRASVSGNSSVSSKSAIKKKKITKKKINKQPIKQKRRSSSISNSSSSRKASFSNFDSENSSIYSKPSFTTQTSPVSQHSFAAESRERARRSIEKANTFLNQLSDSSSDDEHLLSKPLRNPFILPQSFMQNRTEEFSFADSIESPTSSDIYRIPKTLNNNKHQTESDRQRMINQALLADLDDSSEDNYSSSSSAHNENRNNERKNIQNQSLQQQSNYISNLSNSKASDNKLKTKNEKLNDPNQNKQQQNDNGMPIYMSKNVKLEMSESLSYATSDALSEEIDQLKSLVAELRDINRDFKNSFIEEQQQFSFLSQRKEAPLLPLSSSESSDNEDNDKENTKIKDNKQNKKNSSPKKNETKKVSSNENSLNQPPPSPKIIAASMSSSSSFEEQESGRKSPFRTTFSAIEFDNNNNSSDDEEEEEEEDAAFETPEELARKIRAHLRNSPYSKAKISSSTQQTDYDEGNENSSSDDDNQLNHQILLPSVSENDKIITLSSGSSDSFDDLPQQHQNFIAQNQRKPVNEQKRSPPKIEQNKNNQSRNSPQNEISSNKRNNQTNSIQQNKERNMNKNQTNLLEEEEEEEDEEEEEVNDKTNNNGRKNVVPPLPMNLVDNDIRNDPDYPIRRLEWQRRFDRETSSDMEEESPVVKSLVNQNTSQTSPPHVTIIREAHSSTSSDSEDENTPEKGRAFTFLEDSSSSSSSDDENQTPKSRKLSNSLDQINKKQKNNYSEYSATNKQTANYSIKQENSQQKKEETKQNQKEKKEEDLAEMYSKHQFRLTPEQWNKIFGDSSSDEDDDDDIELKNKTIKIEQNNYQQEVSKQFQVNKQTNQKQKNMKENESDDENSFDDDKLNAIIGRSKRNYIDNNNENDN